MVSSASGKIIVPVWSDGDVVKPVVNDDGRIPVKIEETTATQDVDIVACSVTIPAQLKGSDVNIPVDIQVCTATLPVAVTADSDSIAAYLYGWVSSAWHRLPMLRGYSSVYRDYCVDTATGAETLIAYCGLVTTGYIRVVESVVLAHSDTVARACTYGVYYDSTLVRAGAHAAVPANTWTGGPCNITLQAGEGIYVSCYVDHASENIQAWVCGRNIQINV